MRRIAIAHRSRNHESNSPDFAVYCRETLLSESSVRSLQSYVASVDVTGGRRNPRVVDMAVASARNITGIYTEPLMSRFGRSRRTNADSMVQCVRTPQLRGLFANQHLAGQSTFVLNGADASSIHEVNAQKVRSQGRLMTTSRAPGLAASRSRLQNIKLAGETIAGMVSSSSIRTHSTIGIMQLQLSLSDATLRAAHQKRTSTSTNSEENRWPHNDNGNADPTPVHARETVKIVAHEVMGTHIDENAPLMSAGLDSIAAIEFVNTLSERLDLKIEQTALFDHPTLNALAGFLSSELASKDEATTPPSEEEQPVAGVQVLETRE